MNTPRQPNARPSNACFLGQSRNPDSDSPSPISSFVAPFTPDSSPTAGETSGNVTDNQPANDPVTRRTLNESLPIPLAPTLFHDDSSRKRG